MLPDNERGGVMPILEPPKTAAAEASQELAQFEPDPDGAGSTDVRADGAPPTEPADPQWIVWDDAERESAWADDELMQMGAGSKR